MPRSTPPSQPRARRRLTRPPTPHRSPGSRSTPVYRPRRPTRTVLYPVVQHHLETFLARADDVHEHGGGQPPWVEREFRAYLTCGIMAHGFARARCPNCAEERLIPFSCKARGVCPSCTTRRMVEVAAHLVDHVLPVVPARQVVLSVPKRLRPFLHHRPDVATGVLQVLIRALRRALVTASPGAPRDAHIGAVSFFHRFGGSLNPHPHFHLLVLDGVFAQEPDGSVRFHEATALTEADIEALTRTLQRRILRYFHRHDILERHVTDDMSTWQGTGGFSLDASVRVGGTDRAGLERLVRYLARPPFALERLQPYGSEPLSSPNARILYRFPRPTPDGRTALVLSPLELLERLAVFVPQPRLHRHRYHGVLAPNARLRARVIALGRDRAPDPARSPVASPGRGLGLEPSSPCSHARPARYRWAALLARIYEVFPLRCPGCDSDMRVLAFITDPFTLRQILEHLGLAARPPPLAPARPSPQPELGFDQTPAFDPTQPEPVAAYDFDQSVPDEFD
jgi:hypothetical protein